MNILAIQSQVSFGHVGNAAALLPLWRLGHEVWPVATVEFSNHPAHGSYRGRRASRDEIAAMIEGLDARGALADCDAVLSGYLGAAEQGGAVLDAVARVRAAKAGALYCCDPAMAHEDQGLFVAEDIAEFFRDQAVPRADVITPNHAELEFLAARTIADLDSALSACGTLSARGPSLVVVTSLRRGDAAPGTLETLAVDRTGAWLVATPVLEGKLYGAGDLFTALFLGTYLKNRASAEALVRAVASTYGILKMTSERSASELALIAAQDEITAPSERFEAARVG